jgi:hypothetical protein
MTPAFLIAMIVLIRSKFIGGAVIDTTAGVAGALDGVVGPEGVLPVGGPVGDASTGAVEGTGEGD